MTAQADEFVSIEDAVGFYFHGTYEADQSMIRQGFHDNATIVGFFNGEYVEWTLDQFVERVTSGQSQRELGDAFDKKILMVEKSDHIAVVKAYAKVFDNHFIDLISLIKTDQGWKIRHKQFTNTGHQKVSGDTASR